MKFFLAGQGSQSPCVAATPAPNAVRPPRRVCPVSILAVAENALFGQILGRVGVQFLRYSATTPILACEDGRSRIKREGMQFLFEERVYSQ